jgi:hypothetical protein
MTEEEKLLRRALAFMDCYWEDSGIQLDIRAYIDKKEQENEDEKLSTNCCNLVE